MTEVPKLEDMNSDKFCSSCEMEEMGTQKVYVSDQTNGLQYTSSTSQSFVLDMERFSHQTNKDITANSRITMEKKLQRNLSRKGSQRGGEKKMSSSTGNEKDISVVGSSSPRAALVGASMPDKPMESSRVPTNHPNNPQVHHQINIMAGNVSATTAETKCGGKRFSFRRSSPSWAIDPRRILFFFATLSSMGTILLIFFTLSIGKVSGDDN